MTVHACYVPQDRVLTNHCAVVPPGSRGKLVGRLGKRIVIEQCLIVPLRLALKGNRRACSLLGSHVIWPLFRRMGQPFTITRLAGVSPEDTCLRKCSRSSTFNRGTSCRVPTLFGPRHHQRELYFHSTLLTPSSVDPFCNRSLARRRCQRGNTT